MGDTRHFPAFDRLCWLAERRGLQVRLAASAQLVKFGVRKGEEYRRLTSLELWFDEAVESAPIYNDDLEAAALDLLARAA